VLRVAHNCGVRRIARRRKQGLPLDEAGHASEGRSPEEQLVARREVQQLTAAVRQLPLGMRQVRVLTLEGAHPARARRLRRQTRNKSNREAS
jgi:hypothetical protein